MQMNLRSPSLWLFLGCLLTSLNVTVQSFANTASLVNSQSLAKVTTPAELRNLYQRGQLSPLNESLQQAMRTQMKEVILSDLYQEAQKNPHLKIGTAKIADVFAAIDKCQVLQADAGYSLIAQDHRSSDFYAIGTNLAVINLETLDAVKKFPLGILGIYLHICLGADGIDDRNYDVSLALMSSRLIDFKSFQNESSQGSQAKPVASLEKTLELKGKSQFRLATPVPPAAEEIPPSSSRLPAPNSPTKIPLRLQKGGGYTGVGGGGDVMSFLVKAEMLSWAPFLGKIGGIPEVCQERWKNPQTFIDELLNLQIESREDLPAHYLFDLQERILWLKKVPLKMFPASLMKTLSVVLVVEFCQGVIEIEKSRSIR